MKKTSTTMYNNQYKHDKDKKVSSMKVLYTFAYVGKSSEVLIRNERIASFVSLSNLNAHAQNSS